MNIIQLQDRLKDFSEQQLVQEMQAPSGNAPQYLVLSELERRKKSKDRFKAQQQPQSTVAEEAVMQIAQMPTGIMGMKKGGAVKYQNRGYVPSSNLLRAIAMQESRMDPRAVGEAGEIGMYQIMPTTAIDPGYNIPSLFPELQSQIGQGKRFASAQEAYEANKDIVDEVLFNPSQSERFAQSYIDTAKSRFPDDEARAIAAYNLGMTGAEKLEDPSSFPYVQGIGSFVKSPDETRQPVNIPFIASAEASPSVTEQGARIVGKTRSGQTIYADTDQGGITDIKGGRSQSVENFGEDPVILGSVEGESRKAKREAAQELQKEKQDADTAQAFRDEATAMAASPEAQQKRAERGPQAAQEDEPTQTAGGAELAGAGDVPVADTETTTEAESALEKILQLQKSQTEQAQKDEEFNRYLALAQMGAALASSKSPTLLGAAGEAIQTGLPALAESRKGLREAEKEELSTQLAVEKIRQDALQKGQLSEYQANTLILSADSAINRARDDMQKLMSTAEYMAGDPATKAELLRPYEDQIAGLELQKQAILLQSAKLPMGLLGLGTTGSAGSRPRSKDEARSSFKQAAGIADD